MRRLAALALLLAAGSAHAAPAPGPPLEATGTLRPSVHFFGDVVLARIDAVADPRRVDPAKLRLAGEFAPYEAAGAVLVARRDVDGLAYLAFEVPLRCVVRECLTAEEVDLLVPGPATVVAGQGGASARVQWQPLQVATRINAGEARPLSYRDRLTPLPEASWRVAPAALAGASFAAAAVLAAAGLGLLTAALRRLVRRRRRGPLDGLPPLERALVLVALAGDAGRRRKALELLAGRLDGDGLGERARRLAWAEQAPTAEAAAAFAEDVRAARR